MDQNLKKHLNQMYTWLFHQFKSVFAMCVNVIVQIQHLTDDFFSLKQCYLFAQWRQTPLIPKCNTLQLLKH